MLSHLRFHRRGPSNTTSTIPDQPPGWQAAALHQHPPTTYEAVARPDDRPKTSNATSSTERPPMLPPIACVASPELESAFDTLEFDHSAIGESRSPQAQNEPRTRVSSFLGGVALQNQRKNSLGGRVEPVGNLGSSTLPQSHLSRAKPPPPPINTNLTRPELSSARLAKPTSFVTPTDLQQQSTNTRPSASRFASDPSRSSSATSTETYKSRKSLPFLRNPMSTLLTRRKNGQNAPDGAVVPPNGEPTYDPRIRGTRVHDFSAPRPRPVQQCEGTVPSALAAIKTNNHESLSHEPQLVEVPIGKCGSQEPSPEDTNPANLDPEGRANKEQGIQESTAPFVEKSVSPQGQKEPAPAASLVPVSPPKGQAEILRTYSSRTSRTLSVDTAVLLRTESALPMSRSVSAASSRTHDSILCSRPKHTKSTSSRFSFDMLGSTQQEKLLEERHRQREMEKKTEPGNSTRDSRFDDLDDSFDYEDMMDDNGLEEAIPGVNVALEEDVPEDNEADPDDDQENFAGFVFQRSNPTSTLTTPLMPRLLMTPRDGNGKVIGCAMTKDATPDLAPAASPTDCVDPISPISPGQLGESVTGLGIRGLHAGDHMAYNLRAYHQNKKFVIKDSGPWEGRHEDLYYDDGLVDEMDFAHDGPPFDESLFDLDDTDKYGRPIPGAFAKAQEHHMAKQQASKRASDLTSRLSAQSALSRSTAHTSVSLDATLSDGESGQRELEEETSPELSCSPTRIPSVVRVPDTSPELAYQAALAQAAQMAAASGKFCRDSTQSPAQVTVTCPMDSAESSTHSDPGLESMDDYETDPFADDLHNYELDDDAVIAEANASALANDDEGFYGQEFGFFSAPLPSHGHSAPPKTITKSLSAENLYQYFNGGFLGPSGPGVGQSKVVSREPNLTPITERSEYSNRNSIMSMTLPSGIPSNERRNSGPFPSPGLAQLAMMADDDNMSMSALLRLRSRAWGGSQASLGSFNSREGSPGLAEGRPSSPWCTTAWAQNSPALGTGHHSRKNSAFSARSGSEVESASGSPTVALGKTPLPVQQLVSLPAICTGTCPPVLEGDEVPTDDLAPGTSRATAMVSNEDSFLPGSPSATSPRSSVSASNVRDGHDAQRKRTWRRPGHGRKGSAESVSNAMEEERAGGQPH